MTYHAKVISGGKIVIPAEFRREFGIKDGDSLVLEPDGTGGFTVRTYAQVVEAGRQAFRAMVGDDYSVDAFLQEKRADWGDE